ncbi:CD276 antigen homolog [Sinocyclocheilus grahami]|uniref:CD276 antigen homolog n=1 Tax=Sinocyclocheilus grahami TaxID=75366 RepID=UPI0007AC8A88|nr:PREDICTED: CD276 antigen homolog [Sinocyclocheilus grahami]
MGCFFICVFAVLINKVSLHVTVEAVIGGSVVLPCEHNHKLKDTDVHWRDKDSKIVYDIIKGEDSVAEQDPRYKNRAETFPKEYLRGNFSIKLNYLQHTDAGKFNCFITPSSDLHTVHLIINAEKGNKTTEQENQGPETQSDWMKILLICVCTVLVTCTVACFMFHWRKRSSSCLRRNSGTLVVTFS